VGKVALWGANGAIGKSIADALRASGRAYRVVGRNRESLAASFGSDPLAEITVWNPEDAASVRAAAEGIETIVYLVGVDYTRFDLHPILMQATLDGAIAAGVSNVLLIGTVYPYGLPQTATVRENHPRSPNSFKGQKRKEQEDLLLEADRAGRIHGAVLRLPDFYGPAVEKSIIGEAFTAARSGKTANLLGPIDTPHEFMFVPDVGPVVVRLIEEPRAWGKVWHLAGPGTTTQREMLARIERVVGHPVKVRVANKTMLRVMGVFIPLMRELVEMHYLQTNPVILDDSALRELLGPIHKTSYDDGVRATLA
jgi:nucleoside-diphosphate-sugar epimerase